MAKNCPRVRPSVGPDAVGREARREKGVRASVVVRHGSPSGKTRASAAATRARATARGTQLPAFCESAGRRRSRISERAARGSQFRGRSTWHGACLWRTAVTATRQEILREIERHRAALVELEAQLAEPVTANWPPVGFYLTFYIVAGTTIGIIGSLASFIFHIVGSLLVNQDPLRFLRVYGTVFLGARALTTEDLNFFMLVAIVHFSIGAIAGAVFHVLVNRFVPDRSGLQIGARRRSTGW